MKLSYFYYCVLIARYIVYKSSSQKPAKKGGSSEPLESLLVTDLWRKCKNSTQNNVFDTHFASSVLLPLLLILLLVVYSYVKHEHEWLASTAVGLWAINSIDLCVGSIYNYYLDSLTISNDSTGKYVTVSKEGKQILACKFITIQ